MKYENPLLEHNNRIALKNAIIRWVLGNDGYDGAIGGVTGEIPWIFDGSETWDKWSVKFDEAIGGRSDWDVCALLKDNNYRLGFYNFVDAKVNRITEVYQQVVDEINNHSNHCAVVEELDYVDEMGICRYSLVERVYGETKYEIVQKVWEQYARGGSWKFQQFVDAMFSGNSVNLGDTKLYTHFGKHITNAYN